MFKSVQFSRQIIYADIFEMKQVFQTSSFCLKYLWFNERLKGIKNDFPEE